MKRIPRALWIVLGAGLAGGTGCQQPIAQVATHRDDDVTLAAWAQPAPSKKRATTAPVPRRSTTQPATSPASRPARRYPYSAPGARIQQLSFLAVLAASSGVVDFSGGGKEGAESAVGAGGSTGPVGRLGLDAPQPTVVDAVVTRAGLQQGFAAGIGFAADNNIFTPSPNPVSGSMGRCQDLIKAGFFGGDTAACENHFRR